MNTPEAALRLLGELGTADRRWILERLPVSARARLADHIGDLRETPAATQVESLVPARDEPVLDLVGGEDFEWGRSVEQLSAASADALTRALQSEPAWLVDALLRAARWPWAAEVKKGLPAGLRAELATVEREGMRLGHPATEALVHELARRSQEWPPYSPPMSGWRAFVDRVRAGLRR